MTTMTCLCGSVYTFEGSCECECGFVLVETVEITEAEGAEAAMESDTPMGLDDGCDDEPYDIDDDRGYDPYTGDHELFERDDCDF